MDQNAYIEQAAAHFRTLLTEQLNRQARMAQGSPAKDFSRMERIVIGLIPGDGIGPILMAQARRVLEKLLAAELAVEEAEEPQPASRTQLAATAATIISFERFFMNYSLFCIRYTQVPCCVLLRGIPGHCYLTIPPPKMQRVR